jgi:hypothetical protein
MSKIFSLFWPFVFSLRSFFIGLFPLELSIVVRMRLKFLRDFLVDSSFSSLISSWRLVKCSQIVVGDRSQQVTHPKSPLNDLKCELVIYSSTPINKSSNLLLP